MPQKSEKLFDVSRKTVLITGASGYLGQEISHLFAENGSRVIMLGRSEKTEQAAEDIKGRTQSRTVHPFRVDFYDRRQMEETVARIKKEFEVDVLINNGYDMSPQTGFNTDAGRMENLEYDTWRRAFDSGIYPLFYLCKEFGEGMKKKQAGSIINVSSMYGVVAPDPMLYENSRFLNPATYGTIKSGILGLTRYLASFWAPFNIRCNAVSPGPFSNVRNASANSVPTADPFLQKVAAKTLFKRIGRPEELDGVFLLLASDAGSYITGQNLIVDGGWTVI